MSRSSSLRLRATVVAVAASACLLGGVAAAEASPAAPAGVSAIAATEMATFTGSGTGGTQSSAITSAANVAFANAQRAGWQRSQCYLRASDVRATGSGWFTAVAEVFCQR
ncbi:hypothetical protein SAMN05216371_7460 [Streptomyces sp. TLI_053]|uniref:hypothetical protein n=1 Tax=Streptomyces sp. TLI_053 TaxID=1855352 RepID=UPI00087C558F|nr:hypothetical protein [Streptomyces sp. TLI_053]SDT82670.1 hypothetical protein SAMN05216371_7460 [Streptomyces sp. TLI_053]